MLTLVVSAALFVGRVLIRIDPAKPSDVIYVLGGAHLERAVEAADLFRAGFGKRILISHGRLDRAETLLLSQGVRVPTEADNVRTVLVDQLGLPGRDVEAMFVPVGSTADEASAIVSRARAEHWSRLIVITDCSSTRRAGMIFRRKLGSSVEVIARCSRWDSYDPAHWWQTREGIRLTFYEVPKLIAYALGLGG